MQLTGLDTIADITRGDLHLGPQDALRAVTWDFEAYGVYVALVHLAIGVEGIERETWLAPTWMQRTIAHGQSDAAEGAASIAERYLAAWSAGRPDDLRGLYSDDAAITDALAGVSAQGRDAIVGIAAQAAPIAPVPLAEVFPEAVLQLEDAPAGDEPAVFLDLELEQPRQPSQVWLVIESPSPCQGSAIVALSLDDEQRIAEERRFHSAGALDGCEGVEARSPVWWTGRTAPLPLGERVTGSLETASGVVEIRNGSAAADALVQWAYRRFEAARLPAPTVASIRFDPFDDRCDAMPGYADWSDGTTAILVCFDSSVLHLPEDGRVPPQGRLVLHEIGHAWVLEHTDEATRQALMERVGVEEWNDKGELWRERGAEWAAEALAWGLTGTGRSAVPLGMPTCETLADGFRVLTGAEPLTQCPASGQE